MPAVTTALRPARSPTRLRPGRRAIVSAACALAAGLACARPDDAPQEPAWHLRLASERHSDATPLAALGGADPFERLGPRRGANFAYVDDELRAGLRGAGWQVDVLVRQHGSLLANRDALELAAQASGAGAATTDRLWQPHVRFVSFTGAGLAVRRAWQAAPALQTVLGVQVLGLRHWRGRQLDGRVQWLAGPQQYAIDLASDEQDNRLRFPFQEPFARSGRAALFDAAAHWRGAQAAVSAELWDMGWLHWRGRPRQQASLVTGRTASDASGFLLYGPLVEGRNRQDASRQRMHGSWRLAGEWTAADALPGRATLQVRRFDGVGPLLWALGWRAGAGATAAAPGATPTPWSAPSPPWWQVQWHLRERRLQLGAAWGPCEATLGADRLGSAARSRNLGLACAARF